MQIRKVTQIPFIVGNKIRNKLISFFKKKILTYNRFPCFSMEIICQSGETRFKFSRRICDGGTKIKTPDNYIPDIFSPVSAKQKILADRGTGRSWFIRH